MRGRLSLTLPLVIVILCALLSPADAAELKGRGYALCVGIDETPTWGKHNVCRSDTRLIAGALRASGFDSVVLLTDGESRWENRATYANIRSHIERIAQIAQPGDRVFIYLTGTGLAPDAKPTFIPSEGDGETGIPLLWICETLGTSRASAKLIALDVCRPSEGPVPEGGDFNEMLNQINPSGCVLLTATDARQPSHLERGQAVFTRALLDALSGSADEDAGGVLTTSEVCEHVVAAVKAYSARSGNRQDARRLGGFSLLSLARPTDVDWLKRLPGDPNAVTAEMRADALRKALAAAAPHRDGTKLPKDANETIRAAIRLAPGDFRAAEAALDRGDPIEKILSGKVRFVMHRKMLVDANGTTKFFWKWNDRPVDVSFEFRNETHRCVGVVELPAGEYSVSMDKWEHVTNLGTFSDGPYPAVAATLVVMPGGEHEFLMLDRQTGGPNGVGTIFYDGRRICRTDSVQKKSLLDAEIEREDAKGVDGSQVQSFIATAAGQRQAKLYAGALHYCRQAMAKAIETPNRVLVADASREMAFLLAVAKDDTVRNARRALALAEQANRLAAEVGVDSMWPYKDALAAALAENGRFDGAEGLAAEAAAMARTAKPYPAPPHILDALDARTKAYQSKQPWRE